MIFEVACAADRAYLPHAATMLRSIVIATTSLQTRAHFLHSDDVTSADLHALRSMLNALGAELVAHRIDPADVAGLPRTSRISDVMWYRMLLPELLEDVTRIVYLDCDIVATDDVGALMTVDLAGQPVAAVHNVMAGMDVHARRLGLAASEYCNSGVLVLDLDAWRATGLAAEVLGRARREADPLFPDQDALNATLAGRWQRLQPAVQPPERDGVHRPCG